jgi:hypothetical protein
MAESENSYLELQNCMENVVVNDNQQINVLTSQIKELKYELRQRDFAVAQMEIETNLLISAVL